MSIFASNAFAVQTLNTTSTTSCAAQSGTPSGINLVTDFDNGTFGTESGAADQSPAQNNEPYPGQVTGGIYDHFYDINWGDYAYIANAVSRRNGAQHPRKQHPDYGVLGITDPENGTTGRFFASDPNTNTPTLNFTVFNVTPFENYQVSFWAANSEPNGIPNKVVAVVDGIASYTTGPLPAINYELEWKLHSFVFNAGNRTSISFAMESTETGSAGRDFYLDNIEMQGCDFGSTVGSIEGRVFTDSDGNNIYSGVSDGTIADINIELWDTQGDTDASNDIYVSNVSSVVDGLYSFSNLPPNPDYEVRVNTADPDLPTGASAGTVTTLAAPVTAGNITTGKDFGFDILAAFMEGSKTVTVYDPSNIGLYSIPGNDVIYTIKAINRGNGVSSENSIEIIDSLPPEISFFNGNMDASTTGPIAFANSSTGLSFTTSTDVGYSKSATKPVDFAACTDTPSIGYDSSINFICFNPKGTMLAGSPDPEFSVSFRARID